MTDHYGKKTKGAECDHMVRRLFSSISALCSHGQNQTRMIGYQFYCLELTPDPPRPSHFLQTSWTRQKS